MQIIELLTPAYEAAWLAVHRQRQRKHPAASLRAAPAPKASATACWSTCASA